MQRKLDLTITLDITTKTTTRFQVYIWTLWETWKTIPICLYIFALGCIITNICRNNGKYKISQIENLQHFIGQIELRIVISFPWTLYNCCLLLNIIRLVMVYLCKKIDLCTCILVDKTKKKIDTRNILQTNIGNNYFKQFIWPQTLYIIIQEDWNGM